MNVWKLTGAGKLEKTESAIPEPVAGKIKVRVTKVLIGNSDAETYLSSSRIVHPLIPGQFAIGMIAEETENPLFPKGTRVVLHAFVPAPDGGTAKRDFTEDDIEICGQTKDGFLRDLVYLSPEEMTPLPDSVSDNQALLLHHVAFAQATVEALDAQKGQHIAVLGANILGMLVCQMLIYQQAAPVLIDSDAERLNFARNTGVYYSMLADESLVENVGTITGGRLADGAVYVTGASGNDAEIPFRVCARQARIVVSGQPPCGVKLDLNLALRKQLSVDCISNCIEYLETAINLVANKAVSPERFHANCVKENDVIPFMEEYAARTERDIDSFTYADLL